MREPVELARILRRRLLSPAYPALSAPMRPILRLARDSSPVAFRRPFYTDVIRRHTPQTPPAGERRDPIAERVEEPSASETRSRRMSSSVQVTLWIVASRYASSSRGAEQVGDVRARELAARLAGAGRIDRPGVVEEGGVAKVQAARIGPDLSGARDARRQDAVEEVDPALYRREEVDRASRPPSGSAADGRHRALRRRRPGSSPSVPSTPPPRDRQRRSRRTACRRSPQPTPGAARRRCRPGRSRKRPGPGERASSDRRAQLCVLAIASATSARGSPGSTSWSNAIATSEPSSAWISIARSGVSRWVEPSRCEVKVTPSSSTRRRCASEKTWKPPESVRIGPSQPMNR